jgi:methylated-DNA-[protein]-cysteine S-methyltransferase
MLRKAYMDSPLGIIEIAANDFGITSILFENKTGITSMSEVQPHNMNVHVKQCKDQLLEYFNGHRQTFDLSLSLQGSDFQQRVWNELLNIPFGQTLSYLALSKRLGNQQAIRAVAAANGKNTLNIVVPCHRVIGSNGSLTGYGGELWRKKWLLDFEKADKQLSLFG